MDEEVLFHVLFKINNCINLGYLNDSSQSQKIKKWKLNKTTHLPTVETNTDNILIHNRTFYFSFSPLSLAGVLSQAPGDF